MENQDPKKPNGVHHIKPNIIIRYLLALHIDCVLYVYLCIRASNFWKLANPNTQNPRTLFMNKIMIRQNLCVLKYKNPSQTVTYIYDKPNFKERKIFLKNNESEIK